MTQAVFDAVLSTPESITGPVWVDQERREIFMFACNTEAKRSEQVAKLVKHWHARKTFKVLSGWRDELYPVYDADAQILYSIERTAAALFGIVTYGVHMTAYVVAPEVKYGIKIWVPRRSRGKQTYAGMLDNTVAGGMATHEKPLDCVVREAEEEASLNNDFVRQNVRAHGCTTYIYLRSESATGEVGLVQPECEYIFDLELPSGMVPAPNDSEVEEFYLWSVEECVEHLLRAEFKPNCALVMLDFFIRRGILTVDNESSFAEIRRRIHRDLPFPGPWSL